MAKEGPGCEPPARRPSGTARGGRGGSRLARRGAAAGHEWRRWPSEGAARHSRRSRNPRRARALRRRAAVFQVAGFQR
ncbi:unnamed protein product [Prorocentrum cordatum]|uniref:Uncharacterized protein n=1 Tax=Prorocentrum cordatum TaxID=2364126 RepID=A0ABN9TQP2_9DINO|nr:unnamed protein product [Polarella glacialis]